LYGILEEGEIFTAVIRTASGDIPVNNFHLIQYLMYYHGILLGLGSFCALISLVLYGFCGYHCYLVYKNTTTNETFKWDEIKDFISRRERENTLKADKEDKIQPTEKNAKDKLQDSKNRKSVKESSKQNNSGNNKNAVSSESEKKSTSQLDKGPPQEHI